MARITQTADRVYRNAKVYSIALGGTETHAQEIAIKDGKFVYVGDVDGVRAWIGDTTEVIDCNTKALEATGVTKDTDDQIGLIVKEADGSPSGYVKEPDAFLPVFDILENPFEAV